MVSAFDGPMTTIDDAFRFMGALVPWPTHPKNRQTTKHKIGDF